MINAVTTLIILFIVTGSVFLISTSDLVSIFLSIELQSYGLYLLSTIYRDSEPATSGGLMYFLLGGAEWFRKSLLFCLKLSNSGDALKLKVPSCIWKDIYVWANYLCTVIILKMWETKIGYRGSKSIICLVLNDLLFIALSRYICIIPTLSVLHSNKLLSSNSITLATFPCNNLNFSSLGLCSSVRNYSTNSSVVPVKTYRNADLEKLCIIQENIGKAGVYRWINLLNGRCYIGSSVNLGRRLKGYFAIYFLESVINKGRSLICDALLKNGYSNFSLEILEYCEISEVIKREQYYFDLLKPEYNILTKAGSPLGRKHSEETIQKFKNRVFSEETKARMSAAKIGNLHATGGKGRKRAEGAGSPSVQIEVFDLQTDIKTVYSSMSAVAKALGVPSGSIRMYFSSNTQKPYKSRYVMQKLVSG